MMTLALACAALLTLLLFGLGLAVSVERGQVGKLGGIPLDETSRLFRLIRAHGNAAEYVPTAIAIALYCAATGDEPLVVILIAALTLARFVHAFALIGGRDMNRFSVARFVGGMGTYVAGIGLGLTLLARAF